MSISTKTGDDGTTGLWSGERIGKDSLRVECYGTVDELNAFLGDARRYVKTDRVKEMIDIIQRDLFRVAGSLATSSPGAYIQPVTEEDVDRLTNWVYELEAAVPLKGFVIPGSIDSSAKLDICRTVCRRAERRIVALARQDVVDGPTRRFVNRLSDLLFMLARYEEQAEGAIRYK
ncbi:cob(I)yrinic acid a,c-diamide adenosyltransferase [Gracilinema caldarium]|uniref:Corrinoid adenosyltransferase n=1 Tax=Gracilinema caldarium (strain ATCC 51460 / DSM 7334 / H1) TaxID=744872 RepID=F8EWX0_GRAC1|nr:cob(I)yrinic acid a,c-diamide adenosyltransferase [Gracilinema caldarium]AEJ18356.1 ATP/cobalamin adenosyltransferase [Gracilinema caldarium DSM 7334]